MSFVVEGSGRVFLWTGESLLPREFSYVRGAVQRANVLVVVSARSNDDPILDAVNVADDQAAFVLAIDARATESETFGEDVIQGASANILPHLLF